MIVLSVSGQDLSKLSSEAGGHRIQRIPPTERKGRVHTSTVTVAVIDPEVKVSDVLMKRSPDDFRIEWFSGTGKGGQNRNKVQCTCRMTHIPTGITKTAGSRSRESNKAQCLEAITSELDSMIASTKTSNLRKSTQDQIGSGMRGDKRRTYRFRDDAVEDHVTGKGASCDKVMKGYIDLLW